MSAAGRHRTVVGQDSRDLVALLERDGSFEMDRVERPDLERLEARRSLERRSVDIEEPQVPREVDAF